MERQHSNGAHSNGRLENGGLPPFFAATATDQRSGAGPRAARRAAQDIWAAAQGEGAAGDAPGGRPSLCPRAKSQRRFGVSALPAAEPFPSRLGVGVRV